MMTWEEIRRQHRQQWLLVEAIQAHSDGDKRILDDLAVLATFPNSVEAIQRYVQLHRTAPERELYVLHTDRISLDITERHWIGVRGL